MEFCGLNHQGTLSFHNVVKAPNFEGYRQKLEHFLIQIFLLFLITKIKQNCFEPKLGFQLSCPLRVTRFCFLGIERLTRSDINNGSLIPR